jgi:hypothetical protein
MSMTGGVDRAPAQEDRGGKWARTWRLHREAKGENKLEYRDTLRDFTTPLFQKLEPII